MVWREEERTFGGGNQIGLRSPMGSKWRPATEIGLGSPMGATGYVSPKIGVQLSRWKPLPGALAELSSDGSHVRVLP